MKSGALNAPPSSYVSTEVESTRVRRGPDVAEAYAALLDAAASLPVESGPSAVARRLVDCLANIFPTRAIGVCLVVPGSGVPLIELSLPEGCPRRDAIRPGSFRRSRAKWVFELDGLSGSTLHVAPSGVRVDEEPLERAILGRAASLMAAGVRTALVLITAKPVSVEMTELRAQLIQAEKALHARSDRRRRRS